MKNIKKLFIVLLIAVLSICGLNTVSAAASNGSITINNAVVGKTYEIYKIFDLTYNVVKDAEGKDTTIVSYTISKHWEKFFSETGSIYIVELEKDADGKVINPNKLNPITVGDKTKYINITESNIAEFSKAALVYATSLKNNEVDPETGEPIIKYLSKVAESTTVKFENLELGYYLVYPQGATDVSEDEEGNKYASLASITSTLPDATVNVKAKAPEITKDVNRHTFDVGEYAEFTIKGQVPDTTGFTKYDYIIKDEWTKGLELDSANVNFTVTIDGTTVEVAPEYTANGFTLTFDMTKYQDKIGKEIVVTYKLKVTKDAINSITTENKATLTYSNNPKNLTEKTTTPPQIERVYSSKVVVEKVDGANNETKLAGATFVLKGKDVQGQDVYYKEVLEDGKLVKVEWVAKEEDATHKTTDETGVISFEGLENGDYELIETQAPDGYNKLPKPVKVTVSGSYEKDAEGKINEDKPIPVVTNTTVENFTGTSLPSTGGVGTTLFIVVGSLLMIGSLLVLITNKRMSKESL